jgi:hypothetical protein
MGATDNRADQAIKDAPRESNPPTENVMSELLEVSPKEQKAIFEGVGGRGQDVPKAFKSSDGTDAEVVGNKQKPEAAADGERVVTVATVSLRDGFAPGEDSMAAIKVRVRGDSPAEEEPRKPEQREGSPGGGSELGNETRENEAIEQQKEGAEGGGADRGAGVEAEAAADAGRELDEASGAHGGDAAAGGVPEDAAATDKDAGRAEVSEEMHGTPGTAENIRQLQEQKLRRHREDAAARPDSVSDKLQEVPKSVLDNWPTGG